MKTIHTAWQTGLLALATAMERGISKTRRAVHEYIGPGPSACALGAAWINGGTVAKARALGPHRAGLLERFPVLTTSRWPNKDDTSGVGQYLFSAIVARNDHMGWRRDRTARWLRKLAELEQPPTFWNEVAP